MGLQQPCQDENFQIGYVHVKNNQIIHIIALRYMSCILQLYKN
jgi:hypothetical protein